MSRTRKISLKNTKKSTYEGLRTCQRTNGCGPPKHSCGLLGATPKFQCQLQAQPRTKSRSTNGKLIVPLERTGAAAAWARLERESMENR